MPEGEHLVPFGVARIARKGTDLTIASAGQLVIRSLEAADILAEGGISAEVIDLRTIQPLDVETVADSVRRTHRLLVVDEAYAMFGVGAELGQAMNELCFDHLDAPVARLHTAPVTHPFAPSLERAMLVSTDRIVAAARRLAQGEVDPIDRVGRFSAEARHTAPVSDDLSVRRPRPEAEVPARGTVDGTPITMPFGDLTVSEGKLVKWYRRLGESVTQGDHVADIETDKAVVEIESPASGILAEILARDGATVAMGSPIGIVREVN